MIKIEREPFNEAIFKEMLPLAQKCWNECSTIKGETCAYHGDRDFVIEPDFERYDAVAKQDALVIVTLRDDEKLAGFVFGLLHGSLHHKKILCAAVDTIYVEPEFRVYSPVLAEKFEKELKDRGVEIIGWPTHVNGPVYELLNAMGYIGDDIVMEKRLNL